MKNSAKILLVLSLFVSGCQDIEMKPVNPATTPPENVTGVSIKNIAGGAEIMYTIPKNNDLLYVKAVYTIENGRTLEVKSSIYEKSLIVKGYNTVGNEKEFPVMLTCVNRANQESKMMVVKIKPEESTLQKVRRTMTISATWGGVAYRWENVEKEPITFFFLADTIKREGVLPGPLVETGIVSTEVENGIYTSRGYPDVARKFAVVLTDSYGNRTDTIKPDIDIVPLLEVKLDKIPMRVLQQGATPIEDKWNYWEGSPDKLIDNDHIKNESCVLSYQSPWPRFITVDFNRLVKLSRYVMWMRNNSGSWLYDYGNPKTWVLYVRKEPIVLAQEVVEDNDGDGEPDWTKGWTKVGDYEMIKPSGLPDTQKNSDDIAFANNGINYDMPDNIAEVRYFRLGVTSNYGGYGWCNWLETDFYGREINNKK